MKTIICYLSITKLLYNKYIFQNCFLSILAKECKASWKNLRLVYTHALKKPPSGSEVKNMNFLKPCINIITLDKSLPGNLPSPSNKE